MDKVPQLTDVQTPEGETARQVDPAGIGQRKMLLLRLRVAASAEQGQGRSRITGKSAEDIVASGNEP